MGQRCADGLLQIHWNAPCPTSTSPFTIEATAARVAERIEHNVELARTVKRPGSTIEPPRAPPSSAVAALLARRRALRERAKRWLRAPMARGDES